MRKSTKKALEIYEYLKSNGFLVMYMDLKNFLMIMENKEYSYEDCQKLIMKEKIK